MVNHQKIVAGIMAGAASLLLIYRGNISEGSLIAMGMLAFFIGDVNGRKASANATAT